MVFFYSLISSNSFNTLKNVQDVAVTAFMAMILLTTGCTFVPDKPEGASTVEPSAQAPFETQDNTLTGADQEKQYVQQSQITSSDSSSAPKQATEQKDYIIGNDDQVMVSVWRNADLSITVPVRPDGNISTPLVGDIKAAGRTPMQLAKAIEARLGYFIKDPHVTVIITGLTSHEYVNRVRITGAVQNPQSIPFREGMTVLDLVLASGSITEFAAGNRSVLYRQHNGKTVSKRIRLEKMLDKGDLSDNYRLRPGDVLTVPESLF